MGHTESETTTVKLENSKDIPVLGGYIYYPDVPVGIQQDKYLYPTLIGKLLGYLFNYPTWLLNISDSLSLYLLD